MDTWHEMTSPLDQVLPTGLGRGKEGIENREKKRDCDAPKPKGPLTTRQPAENLNVSYHETHTRVKMASLAHKPILTK